MDKKETVYILMSMCIFFSVLAILEPPFAIGAGLFGVALITTLVYDFL